MKQKIIDIYIYILVILWTISEALKNKEKKENKPFSDP